LSAPITAAHAGRSRSRRREGRRVGRLTAAFA